MKKGFTLVELLAVLAIMSLILVLVIPNITSSGNATKEKMYETKKESILKAYKMCLEDGESGCNSVSTLLSKKYIVADDISTSCSNNCIKNPATGTYLDNCTINSGGTDLVCS